MASKTKPPDTIPITLAGEVVGRINRPALRRQVEKALAAYAPVANGQTQTRRSASLDLSAELNARMAAETIDQRVLDGAVNQFLGDLALDQMEGREPRTDAQRVECLALGGPAILRLPWARYALLTVWGDGAPKLQRTLERIMRDWSGRKVAGRRRKAQDRRLSAALRKKAALQQGIHGIKQERKNIGRGLKHYAGGTSTSKYSKRSARPYRRTREETRRAMAQEPDKSQIWSLVDELFANHLPQERFAAVNHIHKYWAKRAPSRIAADVAHMFHPECAAKDLRRRST